MEPLHVAAFTKEETERVSVNFALKIDSVISILVSQNMEMRKMLNEMNNREKLREKAYHESIFHYFDLIKNVY